MTSNQPQPFQINVSDAALEQLQQQLSLIHFPDELDEAGWDYGVPLSDVKRLVARWQNGFDWRKAEVELNELPQFTRDIEVEGFGTLSIHFIHQRSVVKSAIPLIVIHGWPGHCFEVEKIISLLTAKSPNHPSFHVVSVSLPGYGFSEGPKKKAFHRLQYAEVCNKLMLSLGYNDYVAHGGDLGGMVARTLAEKYGGKSVQAWHINSPLIQAPTFTRNPMYWVMHKVIPYTGLEWAGQFKSWDFFKNGSAYHALQSTRPQTLGYALADSPVGLLAWIYEKLVSWTDQYPWTDDEVLTWVSIYWFSRAGPAASLRIYYELAHGEDLFATMPMIKNIPSGVSYFHGDILQCPRIWFRASCGNVVFEAEHQKGGHYPSLEVPEILADDLRKMFGKQGPAHRVVKENSGYTPL